MDTCVICGTELNQHPHGRQRVYCSNSCRQAAYKARCATPAIDMTIPPVAIAPGDVDRLTAELLGRGGRDPLDELGDLIVVARALAARLSRMTLPPSLEWRARTLADDLAVALLKSFDGAL